MKLFDPDWAEALANKATNDELFQKKAKKFKYVYQYVVKPNPDKGVNEGYEFWIRFPEATEFGIGRHEKPDFTMTTSYQVFHDILSGKSNAIKALTTRKAFVAGSLPTLLRFSGAINRIVELMKQIPAEGAGEYEEIG